MRKGKFWFWSLTVVIGACFLTAAPAALAQQAPAAAAAPAVAASAPAAVAAPTRATPAAAAAPTRTAQPVPRALVITMARVHELMTPEERQIYRHAFRQATTAAQRQHLRESQLELLRQRATERGVILIVEPMMARPGERGRDLRSASPPRAP